MANIKCKSCGKRYSYHESDLCPHCGAYNKPSSRMRVDFDEEGNAELLHEREFLRQSAAGRERKDCYEQKECHEEAVRQGKREPSPRREGAGDTGKKTVEAVAVFILVMLALVFVFSIIPFTNHPAEDEGPDIEIVPEAPAEEITDDYIFYYEPGEQFVIDGQTVRVENAAFDAEELLATVYWEKDPTYTPELYVLYEDGRELFTFTWYENNMGENCWQYGYTDDDFGWENVTEAYLSFTNYGWTADDEYTVDSYYEVRVNITDVFQNMI